MTVCHVCSRGAFVSAIELVAVLTRVAERKGRGSQTAGWACLVLSPEMPNGRSDERREVDGQWRPERTVV